MRWISKQYKRKEYTLEQSKSQVTTVASVRLDVLDLAAIAYIYDQLKVEYTSRSNLLGIAFHQYTQLLKEVFEESGKQSASFDSPQQAIDYLCLHKRLKIGEVKVGKVDFQEQLKEGLKVSIGELDPSIRAQELMEETGESVNEKGIPKHLQKK
jgi:DNA-directed RNA polymerase subunit E'/Rpb7